jgi:hypothetical protein
VFFMFFPKTLPYLCDSDPFWFISLYLHLCMTSLDNNIGFIFINNMFLMGFNPRILVLNQNLFRPNHDIKVIIKVNECQNIDPCMMSNMFVSLVWSYMVWVGIHVARFRFECSSCFFFLWVWSILTKKFWIFLFFLCLICFCFIFSSQTQIFGSVYGRIKDFKSTWLGQNWVKELRPCLICNVLAKEVF